MSRAAPSTDNSRSMCHKCSEFTSASVHSGHDRTCCWHDPVAIDPDVISWSSIDALRNAHCLCFWHIAAVGALAKRCLPLGQSTKCRFRESRRFVTW